MALILKPNDSDRTVPNCSDESASDCSSEELIDCDIIVDVTTVTGCDDSDKNKIHTSLEEFSPKQLIKDNQNTPTKVDPCIKYGCDNKSVDLNERNDLTKIPKNEFDENVQTSKSSSIGMIGKHVPQLKSIGRL